jgi:hypothetical protein
MERLDKMEAYNNNVEVNILVRPSEAKSRG